MRHIIWFSCGAASAVAAMLQLKQNPTSQLVYCDTGSEHPDNRRFLQDVESWLGAKVIVLRNESYHNHFEVLERTRYINGVNGARCTVELKKVVRFSYQLPDDVQYFGYGANEKERATRFCKAFPEVYAKFPLIEAGITHTQSVGIIWRAGIQLPAMYRLGYHNNNCIGCVKGGAGYWNKIRRDFPACFDRMATIERQVGHSCIKDKFLDELSPKEGRLADTLIQCDFTCQSVF